jgi:hypothetical protein
MASFDLKFVPGVSASVDAGDTEIFGGTIAYDGVLENDWTNVGTNSRLTAVDASVIGWNTIALGASSRRFDFSSFAAVVGGATLKTHADNWATVSGVSVLFDGTIVVSSTDLTACIIAAGLRSQAVGGVYTPATSDLPQFLDSDTIINNGGAGAGTYPFSGEIISTDARGGLSNSDALTLFRSSTFVARGFFSNDTSTVFTLNQDRFQLRVVGTTSDTPAASTTFRSRTSRPLGFSRTSR